MSYQGTNNDGAEAALGYYYRAFYVFGTILEKKQNDATMFLDGLNNVEVDVKGKNLLY